MKSLDAAYFEGVYGANADPWDFETSPYEREKYDRTIAALGLRHYERALEIGCSIGVLTQRLAAHAGDLLAVDINAGALARARSRLQAQPHVRFARLAIPQQFPDGTFDLIVLSEVAYYWSEDDLSAARNTIAARLEPGGTLLLVHFLPKVPEYVRDGDAVHGAFLADERFVRTLGHRAERYRLDALTRR